MQIKIEIKSSEATQRTIKSKKDGKEYIFRNQSGWVDLGKAYPQEIQIPLDSEHAPYQVGKYIMDPTCLYVDRYGNLSLGRLRLVPAK
jgi:Helix-destabilising protein